MKKILLSLLALLMATTALAQRTRTYNRCTMQNGQNLDFNVVIGLKPDSVEMRTFRPWAHPTINPLSVFRFARCADNNQQHTGWKIHPQQEQIIVTTNIFLGKEDWHKLPKSLTITINDKTFILGNSRR